MEPPLGESQGIAADGELTGRVVGGKYELEHYIGSGASGSVYSARHRLLEKVVALKILHPDMARSASLVELFKREARAASRIDHPNSVGVLDFGTDASGLLYIVMEFVEGPDLLQVLSEEFPLELARVVEIMCQVLAALSMAHGLGVVHRDIKPENILVLSGTNDEGSWTDLIKICDFGIAQLSPAAVPYQSSPRSGSQQPAAIDVQTLVGTPEYMSPEQARSETLDARSDIYSAGVLLFQLVTGRLPFRADTPDVIALMQCSAQPPHPSWFKGVDPRLDAICLKAMSKDPNDRYQSAREMRAAIRELASTPEHPHAVSIVPVAVRPDAQSVSPSPSLPLADHAPLRMPRMAFSLVLLLGSSAAAAAYVWPTASSGTPMRVASSVPVPTTAIAERPSETLVAHDDSARLPLARDVTLPRPATSARVPAPDLTRSGEGTTAHGAERTGRRGSRASTSPAVSAASLAELVVNSAPASNAASGTEPPTTMEEEPQAPLSAPADEPIVSTEVQSGSKAVAEQAARPAPPSATIVAARPIAAAAKPEALQAVARIQDVTVRGSLATSIVQRAMERARPRLSACYAQTAKAAGRNAFGSMAIEVEFDERGRAHWSRAAGGALPGLDRCVNEVAGNLIATQAPDTGTVRATWRVSFER